MNISAKSCYSGFEECSLAEMQGKENVRKDCQLFFQ